MFIASYNPRSFMTRKATRLCALLALALAFCLPAAAQWTEPTAQLARDIAAITGPATVTLIVHNISSLTADYIPVIKRDLQNDLRSAGVRVVGANAAADIKLTLSENAQGYVLVAEVHQANETKVAMVTAPRSQTAAPALNGPLVAIRRTPLWSQDSAILDIAQVQVQNRVAQTLPRLPHGKLLGAITRIVAESSVDHEIAALLITEVAEPCAKRIEIRLGIRLAPCCKPSHPVRPRGLRPCGPVCRRES